MFHHPNFTPQDSGINTPQNLFSRKGRLIQGSYKLGGGLKHVLFLSNFGEMISSDEYFGDGLKPPTSLFSKGDGFYYWIHQDFTPQDSGFSIPLKIGRAPKGKKYNSKHHFSGANSLLASGRVYFTYLGPRAFAGIPHESSLYL